jgi:glucose dehydrogenase
MLLKKVFYVLCASLSLFPVPVQAQVTSERLLRSADDAQNWLMYSGTYSSQRYSGLRQITSSQRQDSRTEVGISG